VLDEGIGVRIVEITMWRLIVTVASVGKYLIVALVVIFDCIGVTIIYMCRGHSFTVYTSSCSTAAPAVEKFSKKVCFVRSFIVCCLRGDLSAAAAGVLVGGRWGRRWGRGNSSSWGWWWFVSTGETSTEGLLLLLLLLLLFIVESIVRIRRMVAAARSAGGGGGDTGVLGDLGDDGLHRKNRKSRGLLRANYIFDDKQYEF